MSGEAAGARPFAGPAIPVIHGRAGSYPLQQAPGATSDRQAASPRVRVPGPRCTARPAHQPPPASGLRHSSLARGSRQELTPRSPATGTHSPCLCPLFLPPRCSFSTAIKRFSLVTSLAMVTVEVSHPPLGTAAFRLYIYIYILLKTRAVDNLHRSSISNMTPADISLQPFCRSSSEH